ncbi:hypothetical protein EYF80_027942 [Liparis tanakae]|uniref:Uncharacterized protein n=1 Tax=Liparis tanakae TaxID=230148 RepID=A0A4Z2H993_9TELE|nr:hypothetical protein EYF80_027942 [Liparis tanakae]
MSGFVLAQKQPRCTRAALSSRAKSTEALCSTSMRNPRGQMQILQNQLEGWRIRRVVVVVGGLACQEGSTGGLVGGTDCGARRLIDFPDCSLLPDMQSDGKHIRHQKFSSQSKPKQLQSSTRCSISNGVRHLQSI